MDQSEPTTRDLTKAAWKKSTHSGGTGGGCVEVATNLPGLVAVRDSKNPTGPALTFTPNDWKDFITAIAAGEFNP